MYCALFTLHRHRVLYLLYHIHITKGQSSNTLPGCQLLYIQMYCICYGALFTYSFFKLNQDVCIDEHMVGFKGRHQLKQYIANKKAHWWGIKLWVLSDSNTGYTHQINVYKGRRNERMQLISFIKVVFFNFKLNKSTRVIWSLGALSSDGSDGDSFP